MPAREPRKEKKVSTEQKLEIQARKDRILNKPAKFKHILALQARIEQLEYRQNQTGIYLHIQEQVICEKRTRLPGMKLFKKGQWIKLFDKIFKGMEKEAEEKKAVADEQ